MKQTIQAPNAVPTANIAVNKSRLKLYKNAGSMPTYYLQKGQEFQIELSNPTTSVVLAKIILNGKAISQGGLVLNPGQRVFLDRYLDVAKKFLFDTYEVSDSDEVKAAIIKNGDIKVEFYKEKIPFINQYNGTITIGNPIWFNHTSSGTPSDFLRGRLTNTGFNGQNTLSSSNISYSSSVGTDSLKTLSDDIQESKVEPNKLRLKSSLFKKTIETGRVEKGSDSDQTLKYVDKEFDYYAFHTIEYKMLPVSQKVNTVEDINVKRYCTDCGTKSGKTDKFCSQCGKKH
jgi:hypothetical protein